MSEEKIKKGKLRSQKLVRPEGKNSGFSRDHEFTDNVQWGKGEDKNEVQTKGPKALDTVTEALIGAVYLDAQKRGCNGMIVVREMLERMDFFDSV